MWPGGNWWTALVRILLSQGLSASVARAQSDTRLAMRLGWFLTSVLAEASYPMAGGSQKVREYLEVSMVWGALFRVSIQLASRSDRSWRADHMASAMAGRMWEAQSLVTAGPERPVRDCRWSLSPAGGMPAQTAAWLAEDRSGSWVRDWQRVRSGTSVMGRSQARSPGTFPKGGSSSPAKGWWLSAALDEARDTASLTEVTIERRAWRRCGIVMSQMRRWA